MTASVSEKRCVYCGVINPDSRDHIPPKGIFPKPRPNNLITVPACKSCNREWSSDDELFKMIIGIKAGMEGKSEIKLWESTKHTVRHNKSLRRLIEEAKRINIKTPGGIIIGDAYSVKFPDNKVRLMCDRIIRALYYHHYGNFIPVKNNVSLYFPSEPNETVLDLVCHSDELKIIGEDREFIYTYGQAEDAKGASIWILLFYKRFLVVGISLPPEPTASIS